MWLWRYRMARLCGRKYLVQMLLGEVAQPLLLLEAGGKDANTSLERAHLHGSLSQQWLVFLVGGLKAFLVALLLALLLLLV